MWNKSELNGHLIIFSDSCRPTTPLFRVLYYLQADKDSNPDQEIWSHLCYTLHHQPICASGRIRTYVPYLLGHGCFWVMYEARTHTLTFTVLYANHYNNITICGEGGYRAHSSWVSTKHNHLICHLSVLCIQ